ncbi:MAG: sigma-70 family RNA polymerase sigma factor [Bryobacteraceae bacterium]|jgi:RNA polymerase sigma-70 factor (ECF subfamily)
MTSEEYGSAYRKGFIRTVRLLITRGLSCDGAQETAQAAWVRGWERLGQLRDPNMVVTWINTIALNMYRTNLRREPFSQELPEVPTPPAVNLAAIDVQRILKICKKKDRLVLQRRYLEEHEVREIAHAHGWSETAVRIRLLRARRAAAKTLASISRSTTNVDTGDVCRLEGASVAIQMQA